MTWTGFGGTESSAAAVAQVRVAGGNLPFTGAESGVQFLMGIVAIILGAILVMTGSRRRNDTPEGSVPS